MKNQEWVIIKLCKTSAPSAKVAINNLNLNPITCALYDVTAIEVEKFGPFCYPCNRIVEKIKENLCGPLTLRTVITTHK